ncbi:MAG: hypothetical protein ACJASX_001440 [Limisphaerales bacterium]
MEDHNGFFDQRQNSSGCRAGVHERRNWDWRHGGDGSVRSTKFTASILKQLRQQRGDYGSNGKIRKSGSEGRNVESFRSGNFVSTETFTPIKGVFLPGIVLLLSLQIGGEQAS